MRAIVFDLDGTLIDSAPDIHAAANEVLASEREAPITLEQARSFIGNGAPVFVQRMIAAKGLEPAPERHARMLGKFLDAYERAVHLTALYPGVEEALAHFRADGWRIGLCTNKPERPTRAVLEHFDLLAAFDAIIGGDSLPRRKPDPAPLRAVLEALDALKVGDALYVGDSEVDAETAQRAGVPFALFTEGYSKVPHDALPQDARFSEFGQLPQIAAQIFATSVG